MPVAIHVYIRDKGAAETDPISVEHVFYGRDEADAETKRTAHLAGCENFAKAEADKRVEDRVETIPDHMVPTWALVTADDEGEEDDEEVIEVEGHEVDGEEDEEK